jgi:hypothetical protein
MMMSKSLFKQDVGSIIQLVPILGDVSLTSGMDISPDFAAKKDTGDTIYQVL